MTIGVKTIYVTQGPIYAAGVGERGAYTSATYVVLGWDNTVVSGNAKAGAGATSEVNNVLVNYADTQDDIRRSLLAALAVQEVANIPYRVVWVP